MFQIPLFDICSKSWILKILKYVQLAPKRESLKRKHVKKAPTRAANRPSVGKQRPTHSPAPPLRDSLPFAFFIVRTTRKGGLLERRGEEEEGPQSSVCYYCNVGNPPSPQGMPPSPPLCSWCTTHIYLYIYKYSEGEVRAVPHHSLLKLNKYIN
jgi:hypothetical protein